MRNYFFEAMPGKSGEPLPFCRFDVAASAGIALAFMYAYAFSLGAWTVPSACKCAGAVLAAVIVLLMTRPRKLVLGAALGIITIRLAFGLLFVAHTVDMLWLLRSAEW